MVEERAGQDVGKPRRSLFVEGYLNDRFLSGFRPPSDYPPSPLPDAGGRTMTVRSCFPGLPSGDAPPDADD